MWTIPADSIPKHHVHRSAAGGLIVFVAFICVHLRIAFNAHIHLSWCVNGYLGLGPMSHSTSKNEHVPKRGSATKLTNGQKVCHCQTMVQPGWSTVNCFPPHVMQPWVGRYNASLGIA